MAQSNGDELAKTHVLVDLPGWGKIWAIKDILAYYEYLEQDRKQHELELLDRLKPPTINDVFPSKPYDGTHTHSDMVAVVKYYEGLIEAERERLSS